MSDVQPATSKRLGQPTKTSTAKTFVNYKVYRISAEHDKTLGSRTFKLHTLEGYKSFPVSTERITDADALAQLRKAVPDVDQMASRAVKDIDLVVGGYSWREGNNEKFQIVTVAAKPKPKNWYDTFDGIRDFALALNVGETFVSETLNAKFGTEWPDRETCQQAIVDAQTAIAPILSQIPTLEDKAVTDQVAEPKQHTMDPDQMSFAVPNHLKREHDFKDNEIGKHINSIFKMPLPDAIRKLGPAKVWEMVEEFDANYRASKNSAQKADNSQASPTTPANSEPSKIERSSATNSPIETGGDTPRNETPPVEPTGKPAKPADPVTGEIVVYDAQRAIERMMQRSDIMAGIHKSKLLQPGVDYGVIPGTGDKRTLLKPGAEKLCTAFGLCPEFRLVDKVANWSPDSPLFYFQYECRLTDIATGRVVATGIGSCNSMESKYRWRNAGLICPTCGKELRKSKDKPEYYCWTKVQGCGATFKENDPAVKDQKVGKVPNDDIFSLINTLDKMAQKRALIDATLIGANASAFYTQDVENLPQFGFIDAEIIEDAA